MEDNTFWNTDEIKKLDLDDIESIAGGRNPRQIELAIYNEIQIKMKEKLNTLTEEEQKAYTEKFVIASFQWAQDIRNAPSDGPDIFFSDYFKI